MGSEGSAIARAFAVLDVAVSLLKITALVAWLRE